MLEPDKLWFVWRSILSREDDEAIGRARNPSFVIAGPYPR